MRIAVIATVGGLLAMTAIASPLVPDGTISDDVYAPAGQVVPQMMQASADAASNVLRVATGGEPVPHQPIDFDNLIRIDDREYELAYSKNFASEVQSSTTVRKIGFGRTTNVGIVTTLSGTYSSDGLMSPHVRYPDIEVRRRAAGAQTGLKAGVWHRGFGWLPQNFSPANSIITFGRMRDGGRFISGDGQACFRGRNYATCN